MTDNWGRWGDADERGALNLLGGEQVMRALGSVVHGDVVSLTQPLSFQTPVAPGRASVSLVMTRDGGDYASGARELGRSRIAEDVVTLDTHTGTHVDSFSHLWYGERLYNGHPQSAVRSRGARRCGVEKLGPIVGRGVLLDVATTLGVPALELGQSIGGDLLEHVCDAGRIVLEAGDIVLVRTGWLGANPAATTYFAGEPGLDLSGARWLTQRDVAAVGADNYAIEVLSPASPQAGFPVHELLLRDMGVPLIEGLTLDALTNRSVGSFLFVGAPLPLVGATASSISAIALL